MGEQFFRNKYFVHAKKQILFANLVYIIGAPHVYGDLKIV